MKHYAQYDENGKLLSISTGGGSAEINKEEYNTLLTMIRTKAELVDKLYNDEITLAEVPTEWQEEIQLRVDERIAMQGTLEEQELSAEEALSIIVGGETV